MLNKLAGKSILVTGHTGFKGAWLTELLLFLGAKVTGAALDPEPNSLYENLSLSERINDFRLDVRDLSAIRHVVAQAKPDLVIHLAAQSLVSIGRSEPVETFSTNIMGTVNLLEAVRQLSDAPTLVVTSDKCYWPSLSPCQVGDTLGGKDPYSASKAAVEIVVQSYRNSFGMPIATARAGNAIGGGDWGKNRLIPDIMRAKYHGRKVVIRHPNAQRPWQHVLDLSWGYVVLSSYLLQGKACRAWNFGPSLSVSVRQMIDVLGVSSAVSYAENPPPETMSLRLQPDETSQKLGWKNKLDWRLSVQWAAQDYQSLHENPTGFHQWIQQRIREYIKMS